MWLRVDRLRQDGLKYFDPVPYLLVSCTPEGTTMATVVVVPGEPKSLRSNNGFGSSSLTVELTNGMITSVGQEADSKIPETLTAALPILGASQEASYAEPRWQSGAPDNPPPPS